MVRIIAVYSCHPHIHVIGIIGSFAHNRALRNRPVDAVLCIYAESVWPVILYLKTPDNSSLASGRIGMVVYGVGNVRIEGFVLYLHIDVPVIFGFSGKVYRILVKDDVSVVPFREIHGIAYFLVVCYLKG